MLIFWRKKSKKMDLAVKNWLHCEWKLKTEHLDRSIFYPIKNNAFAFKCVTSYFNLENEMWMVCEA